MQVLLNTGQILTFDDAVANKTRNGFVELIDESDKCFAAFQIHEVRGFWFTEHGPIITQS